MLENTAFRKLYLFPPSGEGRETPTLLDPLQRVNLNHWILLRRETQLSVQLCNLMCSRRYRLAPDPLRFRTAAETSLGSPSGQTRNMFYYSSALWRHEFVAAETCLSVVR
jgi:hypothetical protein